MEINLIKIIAVIWIAIYVKQLFFWLWLWQLKNYHWGRFKAHFETQKTKKVLSCLWRLKYPRFTKKIILLTLLGSLMGYFYIWWAFNINEPSLQSALIKFFLVLFVGIILTPKAIGLLVLLMQIPTTFWQKWLIEKATKKRKSFRDQYKDLLVIGITGSFGKTSTKEFLAEMLKAKYNVLKTEKHVNAEVGIAKTILEKLNKDHQIFIVEMGAYEKNKIKQVCRMVKPKIGILTGINQQHLATFGSQENIIEAKFELIESLPNEKGKDEGTAIFNGDSDFVKAELEKIANKITKFQKIISTKEKADLSAEDIKIEKEKLSFTAVSGAGERVNFELNLVGEQNIPNILLASECCLELGMTLTEIAAIAKNIKPEEESIKIEQSDRGVNILDSTYSANPDGVMADLNHLKLWSGKKIIVMPCLIELGKASKQIHKNIGQKIAQVCDLAIITTRDRFKEIQEGALGAGMEQGKIILLEKPNAILAKLKASDLGLTAGDVILLESRIPIEKGALLNL